MHRGCRSNSRTISFPWLRRSGGRQGLAGHYRPSRDYAKLTPEGKRPYNAPVLEYYRKIRDRGVIKVGIAYLVTAWLVLQLADVLVPALGLPETAVSWVLAALAVGFAIALVLAWLFDITPEGIQLTDAPVTAVPAVAAGARKSIAVVPFHDLSAEKNQQHFCDGLTEELLNVLTGIPNLRVASQTSSFSLKGKELTVKDIANRLNVAHVLEGSVRKSRNRIRVTAKLVEAATDTQLWSERYDSELDDIFAIQDGIAASVLQALKLKLGAARTDEKETTNPKAYEYFLRGRGYAVSKSHRDVELAAEMFRKAVALDPKFVRAWLNLSEMCAIAAVFFGDSALWQGMANDAADKLEELVPERAESHLARAYALMAEKAFAKAEAELQKSVTLDSTICIARHHLARAQVHQGKTREAADSFAAASRCDPEDYESPILGASVYEGIAEAEKARELARIGVERAEKVLEDYPDNQRAYYLGASAFATLGNLERAREWAEYALLLDSEDAVTRYNSACFYAKIGEIDKALDCLENSVISRSWIENDADLNPLRSHPRYRQILDAAPG